MKIFEILEIEKFSKFFDFEIFHFHKISKEIFQKNEIFKIFWKSISNFFRFQKKSVIFFIDRSKISLRIQIRTSCGRLNALSIDCKRLKSPYI